MLRSMTAIAVVIATPSLGCSKLSGGPPSTPKTASLSLITRFSEPSETLRCSNLRGNFTLAPQRLTGIEGTDHEVTRSFDVACGKELAFCVCSILYVANFGEAGLKPGVWRVDVRFGLEALSCTEQLDAGNNGLFFTSGSAGCSKAGFPP